MIYLLTLFLKIQLLLNNQTHLLLDYKNIIGIVFVANNITYPANKYCQLCFIRSKPIPI